MRIQTGRTLRRCVLMSVAVLGALTAACGEQRQNDSRAERSPDGGPPAKETPGGSSRAPAQSSAATDSGNVPIEINVVVGGRKIHVSGLGECHHTTEASIYEAPASQWHATYAGEADAELQHLNLTVWELKSGGAPQVTLAVLTGSGRHEIATVKGGPLKGSGSATVPPAGAAGTLSVTGKDDGGTQLLLSVSCDRFTEPVAEGG